jgi:hypothetical protein
LTQLSTEFDSIEGLIRVSEQTVAGGADGATPKELSIRAEFGDKAS